MATRNRGWEAAQHKWRARTATARNDAGYTVIELLVTMVVLVILGTITVAYYHHINRDTTHGVTRTEVHGTHLDASSLLARDVSEAETILTAEATELKLNVIRDGSCWTRDYTVAASTLTVATTYYEGEACSGASTAKIETLVKDATALTAFTYYSDTETVLAPPIDDLGGVKRVEWNLASLPQGFPQPITYKSAARFNGYGDKAGDGKARMQDKAPTLRVTTGTAEGKNNPVLAWDDNNPSGANYVASWVLLRSANPEGTGATDPARATWQQVGPVLPAAQLTYTDATLPAGYTATYILRPTLSDGTIGKTSNAVVTGMRPAQVTGLTVTGGTTTLTLNWTKAVGATGYDVYRDNTLIANLNDVATFTDGASAGTSWVKNPSETVSAGYGHSHVYTVTAQNRWESLLTRGAQNLRAAVGDADTLSYTRGGIRLTSVSDFAFTAPAPPALSVTANADWSWSVAWTPAGWVGKGATTKGADGAGTREWGYEINGTTAATPNATWTVVTTGSPASTLTRRNTFTEATAASRWHHYRASTCNVHGCSPVSPMASALQRPSAPTSCTAAKTGTTTRQMMVSVAPAPAVIANSGYKLTGGSAAPSGTVTGLGDQAGTTFSLDHLADGTTHTFSSYARNSSSANGGYSDAASCSGTTDALGASVPSWSATTRKVTASFTPTRGTGQSMTVAGSAQGGTTGSWDGLADGKTYNLVATNTDGDNTVTASTTAKTQLLTQPSCSVSGGGRAPSGTLTVSASGSNGSEQVSGAGSGFTTASSKTYTFSSPGTFSGQARATDGVNYTSAVNCGSVYVDYAIAAPSCANASNTFGSGPSGGRITSLTYCLADGPIHYTVNLQTKDREFGYLTPWASTDYGRDAWHGSGGTGSPDNGSGMTDVATEQVAPDMVGQVQWRVRNEYAGGASSSWSTSAWVSVPA